ncbi:MAG: tetratricopeptide repeat protein [Hyphomonas sp.]|uniref:tetratricopeptide repeat protein n=1 Tax=Hyphomonas sp. TaxID=87 RepID=UPI00180AD6DD|nr:tetratricopeptide repeat protein [Hyphomonas sp.]MBA3069150.1 tetratricopeptide repeat protein [Hyphomonas sp.]MBU3922551.1 tetratricopeptide repeat protein [Alphaproteobacteria bacterium]MBU4062335.1 tetratricopeptide repeat protein [Alphaproteobacteria bacterium]MBU4162717.1 tetratricopeptide repeat protein [Alphaproteobacteria bacterium]
MIFQKANIDKASPVDAPSGAARTWPDCMRAGSELARSGKPAEAAAMFARALELRPGHVPALHDLGAVLLRSGAPARALAVFDAALKLAANNTDCLHGRGLALHALGDVSAAMGAFRNAAASDPKAWKTWQSMADTAPDEPERVFAVRSAADVLERLCLEDRAPASLFDRCSRALVDAHRFEDAVHFAETHRARFRDLAAAHNAEARAHYNIGAFRAAFRHKALALAHLETRGLPQTFRPSAFDPGDAARALRAFSEILRAQGIVHFLAAGTLLGFHRNGRPLPHDRDIDIGVLRAADGSPDIAGLLRTHPGLICPRAARPGERYFGTVFQGTAIDIFLHDARDGALVCGLGDLKGDIQWRFSAFGLVSQTYQGEAWSVPDDRERYLSETYGPSWRTPDKGFASAISSPALYKTDDFTRAYYAAARAANALMAGDTEKARALVRQSPISFALPPLPGDVNLNTQTAEGPGMV